MLKYLLFCTLIAPLVWGTPLPVAQSDISSHIVIVTPQAQVHLEPAIKYDTAAFIHHLSPLARITAPHEETIVYVPASAGAPIIPVENVGLGRASANEQPQKLETKQWDQISQQIQQAVQTGSAQLGPQLSEAASAASSAAAAAGQGLFPALFPPAGPGSGVSSATSAASKDDKPRITYELPANTEALLPNSARIYALTPAVSHVVDFVHSPIFVGPISAIRARSILSDDAQAPLKAVPLLEVTEELPLKDITKDLQEAKQTQSKQELNNKPDYGRFLGANTLKDPEKKPLDESEVKKEKFSEDQYLDTSNKLSEPLKEGLLQVALPEQPAKLKIASSTDINVGVQEAASKGVIREPQPQSKVA
ncbi:uncharacterized protein LOC128860963 [Anastrepha ludens]|uniref:uncharacterized protein LOC128860963 n=1 Tax=Anastrepha ludens TaxID=28586 RepID=UPI0023B05992|nr:uncharacterized protein LOC128860963 [Anastrepha ludens]